MSFGLNINNGGEFLPYVKLDGKDGAVSRSTYDGNARGTVIIENLTALFDFATTRVGWLRFEGETPDMRLAAIGDPMPDRPGEDYKQGIKMVIMLPNELGPHELATTATGVLSALETLHDEVLAAPEWEAGQVPVGKITGWQKEKTKKGSRAIPEFAIVGWKERPEALKKFRAEAKPRASIQGSARTPKPPTTGSVPVQPPRLPPEPEADFG
ncbi:MAG: hypothetical protein E5W82_09420 [Mesorhizobium sp.]|nr:MAG: hypothetical protein E5W82_09420 [Mesorhizobium sp.]